MSRSSYRYLPLTIHLLVWLIVLFFPFLVSRAADNYSIGPLPGLYFTCSGFVHMLMFYGNAFFLYPKLLNRAYWWLYIIAAVLLVFLSVLLKNYILDTWFPDASPDARTHVLFPSVIAFIAGVFYAITIDKIRVEKMAKENEALQLGMELKFLRSQVSPHFLFNTITNLVSLARKKSDQLESSLLMLAGLMRYMLHDAGKKISIQQEIEYLQSYIALQKLRFGGEVKITFVIDVPPEASDYNIEPMLLIAFVENAFKHGTDYEAEPLIDINLSVRDGILDFGVKNKFDANSNTSKDEISGIGLSNVRSRLALLYPGRHELVIDSAENFFQIHLTLELL